MRSAAVVAVLLLASSAGWVYREDLTRHLGAPLVTRSAHERYASAIRSRNLDETDLGRRWLEAGRAAVGAAEDARSPFGWKGTIGSEPAAIAWRFAARRGHRIAIDVTFDAGQLFVDLLECTDTCRPVADAAEGRSSLEHEVREDTELVLRVQPELLRVGAVTIAQRAEATLHFPVAGVSRRAIQSRFGDARDRGRRAHEGVDIFAPRGTPVLAGADGLVTGATSNRLGGNVVWVWSPVRRLTLYYAHLDRQSVAPGDRVRAGDVLGWVGNTGNARSTAPHLHFGVYARPRGAVDPLPYICDAPCGVSRRQESSS